MNLTSGGEVWRQLWPLLKSIPELWEAEIFTTVYITLYVRQSYQIYLLSHKNTLHK
jgi:hypothetical protein